MASKSSDVATGFSLRQHRLEACATKVLPYNKKLLNYKKHLLLKIFMIAEPLRRIPKFHR
jgi:hypothetical protein